MITLLEDLRLALRNLRRNPRPSLGIILVLATGVSLVTAVFAVAYAVLFRPLPYPVPEQLVQISNALLLRGKMFVTTEFRPAQFEEFRSSIHSFQQLVRISAERETFNTGREPEQVPCLYTDPEFFSMLGAQLERGRFFAEEEIEARTAILTHHFRQSRFPGEREVIGKTFSLEEKSYQVIGVLRPDFHFYHSYIGEPVVYVPIPGDSGDRTEVLGRLANRVSLEAARDELEGFFKHREGGALDTGQWIHLVTPLLKSQTERIRTLLAALLGAASFVLLIACANGGNLILLRGIRRAAELATRSALGAGRLRLARMILAEGTLLGVAAGLLAYPGAYWLIRFAVTLSPSEIPRLDEAGLDPAVVGFIFCISFLSGLVGSTAPLLNLGWSTSWDRLRSGRGGGSHRGSRFRNLLVVVELALAIILSAGCILTVRSFLKLSALELGFERENLLTWRLELPQDRYPDAAREESFIERLLTELKTLPGVEDVSLTQTPPLSSSRAASWLKFKAGEEPPGFTGGQTIPGFLAAEDAYTINLVRVARDYFGMLEIPLVRGRLFDARDREGSPLVAVISRRMAQELWGDRSPIGVRVPWGTTEFEIVGVVEDLRYGNLRFEYQPTVYLPFGQTPGLRSFSVLARTRVPPVQVIPLVREAVWNLDPLLPLIEMTTVDDLRARWLAEPRYLALLFSSFATVALALAASGLYGVLAFAISLRIKEIGIRRALGAETLDILGLVLRQGLVLAVIGGSLGVAGVLALNRFVESFLFGSGTDSSTLALLGLSGVGIALLAMGIPCLRAARVDPVQALRHE